MRNVICMFVLALSVSVHAEVTDAVESRTQDDILLPTDTSHNTRTGTSIDLNNGVIAAGAPENCGFDDSGMVYIWENDGSGWVLTAELTETTLDDGDEFGCSVELSDDGILVVGVSNFGASGATYQQGTAYVYTDWTTSQELASAMSSQNAHLGSDVAIDGERIALGAPLIDIDATESGLGAMSVFEWVELHSVFLEQDHSIAPDDIATSYRFAEAISIDGDWLVAGNAWGNVDGSYGSVHVFQRQSDDSWSEVQILTVPSDITDATRLGVDVSVNNGILVVGAYSGDMVFVYELNVDTWEFVQTLEPIENSSSISFGSAVNTDGDRIVVGSVSFTDTISAQGAAWVYERRNGTWLLTHQLLHSDPSYNDFLGASVSIDGTTVIASSYNDDTVATNSGAVYVFEDVIADCNGNGIADALDLAEGTSYDCNGNEVPDSCENDCNGNGIADECDIADGTSADCDSNDVPDECDPDCNANGSPDACDLADDSRRDYDANETLDECESIYCWNLSTNTSYSTIESAISSASEDEELSFYQYAADNESSIDFDELELIIHTWGDLTFDSTSSIVFADGAALIGDENSTLAFDGSILCLTGDRAIIQGDDLAFSSTSTVEINPGAILSIDDSDGSFLYESSTNLYGGVLSIADDGMLVQDGVLTGFGIIDGSMINNNEVIVQADFQVIGDCLNTSTGVIAVQSGVFTVFGSLTNDGTIVGDYSGFRLTGNNGVSIFGDFNTGSSSALQFSSSSRLSLAGDFDCAIDNPMRIDMSGLEMRFVSTSGTVSCEVCSQDVGETGFAVENALVDTLRIGPSTGITVQLVDQHQNNASSKTDESVYVNNLVVDNGVSFITNGFKIYCRSAEIGSKAYVDNLDNIIIVDDLCVGDLDGNMVVNVQDLLTLIAQWGVCDTSSDCIADFDDNGAVSVSDLLVLIAAWGDC